MHQRREREREREGERERGRESERGRSRICCSESHLRSSTADPRRRKGGGRLKGSRWSPTSSPKASRKCPECPESAVFLVQSPLRKWGSFAGKKVRTVRTCLSRLRTVREKKLKKSGLRPECTTLMCTLRHTFYFWCSCISVLLVLLLHYA